MLVAVVAIVLVALTVYLGLRLGRWRRTPPELRGDWWSAFEEEFRADAGQTKSPPRSHPHRNDHGSIGQ